MNFGKIFLPPVPAPVIRDNGDCQSCQYCLHTPPASSQCKHRCVKTTRGGLAITEYLLLLVIGALDISVGVTSTEQDAKSRRSPTDLKSSRGSRARQQREEGGGGDGEHWSVGNCEKQNINIAQKFY